MEYIHHHSGFENGESTGAVEVDEHAAKAAIFYSINSTQPGLRGVELGNYLIKRVAQTLRGEWPNLETFCTLSPVPGFVKWLRNEAAKGTTLLNVGEEKEVISLLRQMNGEDAKLLTGSAALVGLLDHNGGSWHDFRDGEVREALRPILLRLASRYLIQEKKGSRAGQVANALDPVANFHLRNGAELHGINWYADPSAKGLATSAGIMVNYLYDLGAITARAELYSESGLVAHSKAVSDLL